MVCKIVMFDITKCRDLNQSRSALVVKPYNSLLASWLASAQCTHCMRISSSIALGSGMVARTVRRGADHAIANINAMVASLTVAPRLRDACVHPWVCACGASRAVSARIDACSIFKPESAFIFNRMQIRID